MDLSICSASKVVSSWRHTLLCLPQKRASNPALGTKEMEGLFRDHLAALGASAIADYKALLNEVLHPTARSSAGPPGAPAERV